MNDSDFTVSNAKGIVSNGEPPDLQKVSTLPTLISKEEEEALKEKSKKISILEGSAFSISEGFGLRQITAYALALGANNLHIGFLTSVPALLGNFSHLFTVSLMTKMPRKKIIFLGALAQAIMWLFMILVGALYFVFKIKSSTVMIFLILVYTLLFLSGAFFGPAWNSWMKDLVTKNIGNYFSRRSTIIGIIALLSMLAGGLTLDHFKPINPFIGFSIIFSVAFLSRGISAYLFTKKYEPELVFQKEYYFSFIQFLKAMKSNNFGRFVIYVSLMSFAVALSSPFFAVYMLKDLGFSYISYTAVIASTFLSMLIFLPLWGKFADEYGNLKVIEITSSIIPFIPLLWLSSLLIIKHFSSMLIPYLITIEVLSGFAWAGFNLSTSNFIYDAVTRQRMALCIAYYSILNGLGVFIGASLGGIISSAPFSLLGLKPILFVFLLSGLVRLSVFSLMFYRIKEVREVKKFGIDEAKMRFLTFTQNQLAGTTKMINLRPI